MTKKLKAAPASGSPSLTYHGPNTGFEHAGREYLLVRGETYQDLPSDHNIVVNLLARKLLVPAAALAAEPAPFTGDEF